MTPREGVSRADVLRVAEAIGKAGKFGAPWHEYNQNDQRGLIEMAEAAIAAHPADVTPREGVEPVRWMIDWGDESFSYFDNQRDAQDRANDSGAMCAVVPLYAHHASAESIRAEVIEECARELDVRAAFWRKQREEAVAREASVGKRARHEYDYSDLCDARDSECQQRAIAIRALSSRANKEV